MNVLFTIFNSSLVYCLGWTLMHFLWQGIIVGAIYVGVRQLLQGKSPTARYRLAMCALSVMAVLPIITFIHLANATMGIPADATLHNFTTLSTPGENLGAATPYSFVYELQTWLQPLIPWTVPMWLAGVSVATMRVFRSWRQVHRLQETASIISLKEWQSMVESLSSRFGISKIVRVAVSAKVTVPSVIGWLKPLILIPPSAMAGLTPLQMELILAHELAHIRRQDYLWNLMQLAIETLLFYHPVVRWISHQGRLEREQCCDDMVVEKHGNAVEYARALTELECLRHPRSALLLGANGGQVLMRIHRLLGESVPDAPIFWLPLLLVAGFLVSASIMQFTHQKITLQSMFSAKYTLLAEVKQQHVHTLVKSSISTISPTPIHMTAGTQPTNIKQVRVLDRLTGVVLRKLPRLAETIYPVETNVNTPAPVVHIVSTQNLKPATVIEKHAPVYPALALERGVEGSATVEFILTSEGNIIDVHVTHVSGSRLFGQAAIDALRQWKISPTTLGGVPVTQHMAEEFIFQLKAPATKSGVCKIPVGYHVCTSN